MQPAQSQTATVSIERFFQFSLLGLVTSGYLALAGSSYLDRPTLILTFLGLAVRAAIIAGLFRLRVSTHAVSLVALAYIAFFPIDVYFLSRDFLAATVHGVCFLAIVKIFTAQSNRDFIYTGAISFIELIAAALLSAKSTFFLFLALYLVFAIATFTSAEIRRGLQRAQARKSRSVQPPGARISWRLALVAGTATAGILVITAGLFLIVPRTAVMAAMLFPNSPRLTGFSNVVDLGGFGKISRDDRPVMHILSAARPLPPNLKWRGAALTRFDGRRWYEPPSRGSEIPAAPNAAVVADRLQLSRRDGHRMLYRVDIQNADTGTLFIAGIPEFINVDAPRLLVTPEASYRVLAPARETLRYQVSAHSGPPVPTPITRAERARNLQFPPLDGRIVALARGWAGDGSDLDGALNIEQHLRKDFKYKLDGPQTPVADPLADFLFVRKEGYCEYFASAMAVMLRSLGIPARVATGFQSGYFNDVSGLYVIRASDAHAWVEAWIQGRGWLTFDPTPVSITRLRPGLLSRLNMYFDAADNAWREWVVSYDLGHQAVMAARFEAALRRSSRLPAFSIGKTWYRWIPLSVVPFLPGLWRKWRKRSRVRRIIRKGGSPADAALLYERMLEHFARQGHLKSPSATPSEFARDYPLARRFTDLYNSVRFGEDTSGTARLAEMLEEFKA